MPRESHAAFAPDVRLDPIDLLQEQAKSRVPELVPIRYGRMGVSAFTFYRGAALIMTADLSTTPTSGLVTQLCGDAHLSNFGMFGSPERQLVFDVNDFDETSIGPWEWDVKRLAASLEIAGRDDGFTDKERRKAVLAGVREYRTAMRSFADMTDLEVWYAHVDVDQVLPEIKAQTKPKRAKELDKALAKVRTRDNMQAFTKLTQEVDGEPKIVSRPPLIVPLDEFLQDDERDAIEQSLVAVLSSYRKTLETDRRHLLEGYTFVEAARKVVGVGSVGTEAWIVLMMGVDSRDPLILQAKEADASVLERFAGKSGYGNHGQRVVAGQRLMQATSDIFLGWDLITALDGTRRDYYFRQFRDWKGSVEDRLVATERARDLCTPVWLGPGTRARPIGRQGRPRVLPGKVRCLRPGDRRVLRHLRRPERTRLRGDAGGHRTGHDQGRNRGVGTPVSGVSETGITNSACEDHALGGTFDASELKGPDRGGPAPSIHFSPSAALSCLANSSAFASIALEM